MKVIEIFNKTQFDENGNQTNKDETIFGYLIFDGENLVEWNTNLFLLKNLCDESDKAKNINGTYAWLVDSNLIIKNQETYPDNGQMVKDIITKSHMDNLIKETDGIISYRWEG